MQDQAQQEPQPNEPEAAKCYPVLSVELDDFEDDLSDTRFLDEQQAADQRKRLEFVRNMTPEQWKHLGNCMGETLFESDSWHYAMEAALDDVMECAKVVPNRQATQEAASAQADAKG
jgi:hypothetical protein